MLEVDQKDEVEGIAAIGQVKELVINEEDKRLLPFGNKGRRLSQSFPQNVNSQYRPDVDGLRTIAVMVVLVYHAWPTVFPSGFIGVDIFFVISGYLISRIIFKQQQKGTFSLKTFYSRRIRRIFPALIPALITTLILGHLYLWHNEYKAMLRTLISGTLFVTNLQILYKKRGYFDSQNTANPLLHLWSLGVEEQFYIFWPLFSSILFSIKSLRSRYYLIGIFTIVSFVLNVFFLDQYPLVSFYFPFCRFWEMSVGGALALVEHHNMPQTISKDSTGIEYVIVDSGNPIHDESMTRGIDNMIPTLLDNSVTTEEMSDKVTSLRQSEEINENNDQQEENMSFKEEDLVHGSRKKSIEVFPDDCKPLKRINENTETVLWPSPPLEKSMKNNNRMKTSGICSFAGLLAFMIGFLCLNEKSDFPGYWALLPTLGTVAILYSSPNSFINRYVLGNPVFVNIGKISYPLYLWHWPLLVFSRRVYPQDTSHHNVLGQPSVILLISFVFSILTYNFIEKTIRFRKSRLVVVGLCGMMVIIGISGTWMYFVSDQISNGIQNVAPTLPTNGLFSDNFNATYSLNSARGPRLKPPTIAKLKEATVDWKYPPKPLIAIPSNSKYYYKSESVEYVLNEGQEEKLVVMGDSHANQLSHRFVKLFEDAQAKGTKFPTILYYTGNGRPALHCSETFLPTIDMIKRLRPNALLISLHWPLYLNPNEDINVLHSPLICCGDPKICKDQSNQDVDELLRLFAIAVREITSMNIPVYIATMNSEGPEYDPRNMRNGDHVTDSYLQSTSLLSFRKKRAKLLVKVEKAIRDSGAKIIDYSDNYCVKDSCKVTDANGNPIMADSNHFRVFFARNYLQTLDAIVETALHKGG